MYSNYYYLTRAVLELNAVISGKLLTSVFTQEKDILTLMFREGDSELALQLCTSANDAYIDIRNNYKRSRRNFLLFFEDIYGSKCTAVKIAKFERIIQFEFSSKKSLYFVIRGPNSNVYFDASDTSLKEFKKVKNPLSIDNISVLSFSRSLVPPAPVNNLITDSGINEIKKYYPWISKEIYLEVMTRNESFDFNVLITVINEIVTRDIIVGHNILNNFLFLPASFHHQQMDKGYLCDSYFSALRYYKKNRIISGNVTEVKNRLLTVLKNELEITARRLNDLNLRLQSGNREEYYYNVGQILLNNINTLKKGMSSVLLVNISGETQNIDMAPLLSPSQNIDKYFKKSSSERINYKKSIELWEHYKTKFSKLQGLIEEISQINSLELLKNYNQYLKMSPETNKIDVDQSSKFRKFIIFNKWQVFVGKDNENNDLLTTRFAKQNDFWFHARSVPGSHVVLRIDNNKESVPKNVLEKAAALAAFYSKAKTSKLAPVTYTRAKYVYKKKGLAPGQVLVTKEDVLLVKPEIPSECVPFDQNISII